jgi:hypothetical protein
MTIGSAASRASCELAAPLSTFQSLDAAKRQRSEPALSGESDAESEIWYPIAPQTVSWPRVFPQL